MKCRFPKVLMLNDYIELFKTVLAYVMAFYLFLYTELLRCRQNNKKHIEKLSRRHFINSFDVSEVLGQTVSKRFFRIKKFFYNVFSSLLNFLGFSVNFRNNKKGFFKALHNTYFHDLISYYLLTENCTFKMYMFGNRSREKKSIKL